MVPSGNSLAGDGSITKRLFHLSSAVGFGQVICLDQVAARTGEAGDPASVNDYSEFLGICMDATPPTYTTTQGTGTSSALKRIACSVNPFQVIKGRVVGGTAADTAFAEALNGNLLTNTAASAGGTVVSDTDVGTSEFLGGLLVALSGQNKGACRVINAHTDDVSLTVAVPFDYALPVDGTFLRTFGVGLQGLELVATVFTQFNGAPGAGVDLPDTGHAIVFNVTIDIGSPGDAYHVSGDRGSATAPLVFVDWVSADHAFNSLA